MAEIDHANVHVTGIGCNSSPVILDWPSHGVKGGAKPRTLRVQCPFQNSEGLCGAEQEELATAILSRCPACGKMMPTDRCLVGGEGRLREQTWLGEKMLHLKMAAMKWKGSRAAVRSDRTQSTAKASPYPQITPQGIFATARHWGITKTQLRELYDLCVAADGEWSGEVEGSRVWSDADNVRVFVERFVKPITRNTKMGYALWRNMDQPQDVTLMVSHAWDENAKHFFKDVLHAMADNEVAYICFLSNYQGSLEEVSRQLGKDVDQLPFTEVLKSPSCKRLLVVANDELRNNHQGLYSRMWCVWEIFVGVNKDLPIHFAERDEGLQLSRSYLWAKTASDSSVSCFYARCGNPCLPMNEDEQMIRKAIEQRPIFSAKSKPIIVCLYNTLGCCACIIGDLIRKEGDFLWERGAYLGILVSCLIGLPLLIIVWMLVQKCCLCVPDRYKLLDEIISDASQGQYASSRKIVFLNPICILTSFGLSMLGHYLFLQAKCDAGNISVPTCSLEARRAANCLRAGIHNFLHTLTISTYPTGLLSTAGPKFAPKSQRSAWLIGSCMFFSSNVSWLFCAATFPPSDWDLLDESIYICIEIQIIVACIYAKLWGFAAVTLAFAVYMYMLAVYGFMYWQHLSIILAGITLLPYRRTQVWKQQRDYLLAHRIGITLCLVGIAINFGVIWILNN